MNSNKLVSIIVPVYNSGISLKPCLLSIVNQDYKNLEIILVNDGSTDDSLKICEQIKIQDDRVKIINQRNLGVSAARNKGFYNSLGQYVCFIDSDDIIEHDMISTLANLIEKNNCEVSACNIHIVDKDKTERNFYSFSNEMIFEKKDLKKMFLLGMISHACWDKLYKREVLEQINFPIGTTGEDRYFCWQLYKLIDSIAVTPKVCYHYIRKTENSITSKPLSLKNMSRIEEALNVKNDIILHFPELYNEWEFYYLKGLDNLASKFVQQNIENNNIMYKYFEFILSELKEILTHENIYISAQNKRNLLQKYKNHGI